VIPVGKALKIIDENVDALASERVALDECVGRILAEDIVADSDMPPFDRAQMDGYAVRARDTRHVPVNLRIVGESVAGRGWHKQLEKGEAVRIMTGAPVPEGADSVQKIELTKEYDSIVSLIDRVPKGQFIVEKGKEIRKGTPIIAAGSLITPEMIATPAAFGYSKLKVAKRPRVAIITTGSEIVEVGKRPKRDQIRDSNSVLLKSLCERAGANVISSTCAVDDLTTLVARIETDGADADIVITTGGVSVGKYDLTKAAFLKFGAKVHFDRVSLKPGKPAVFAKRRRKVIFGLPGNPVSAAVTFHLFVRRALGLLQSSADPTMRRGFASLYAPLRGNRGRDTYFPARLVNSADGKLVAVPLAWSGSSDFVSFAYAEALVVIPKLTTFNEGDVADILYL
jgi:molybdenum cofactor synthesis domain-containing protein